MKAYAILPKTPPALGTFSEGLPWWGVSGNRAPLELALLAALCPEGVSLMCADQDAGDPVDFEAQVDVVLLLARAGQLPALRYLAGRFRARGIPVVVAGSAVNAHPNQADMGDLVLLGPLERTWKALITRWQAGERPGKAWRIQKEAALESLLESPLPAWNALPLLRYRVAEIEVARAGSDGQPADLDDASPSVRYKTAQRVVEELEALVAAGCYSVRLEAPDLLARPVQARAILEALADFQVRAARKVRFETRIEIASTQDEGLLTLLPRANVRRVEVALNGEQLTQSHQHEDPRIPIEAVRRLLERGVRVSGLLSFGREGDDTQGMAGQVAVARESFATPILLAGRALPGSALYARLKEQARLVSIGRDGELRREVFDAPNYQPPFLGRDEVAGLLKQLLLDLYEPARIELRLKGLLEEAADAPPLDPRLAMQDLVALLRMLGGSYQHPSERRLQQAIRAWRVAAGARPNPGLWHQLLEQVLEEACNRSLVSRVNEGRPLEGTVPVLPWKQRALGLAAKVVGRFGPSVTPSPVPA